ncbi:MAG TPA: winged helix-turn-helix domain-containing protein [Steroidobacteraceae bacterium]|nr:winged helix-turn-helix domain-containing protein [Steroidobacteraceae bacterium]
MICTVFTFDDFRLVPAQWALFRNAQPVKLEPKVFDALHLLVEKAGQVITREEMIAKIWPGVVVEDGSLLRVIVEVRRALGDKSPYRYVENIRGRGYRFSAPVTVQSVDIDEPLATAVPQDSLPVVPTPKRYVYPAILLLVLLLACCATLYYFVYAPPSTIEYDTTQLTFNSSELPLLAGAISPDGKLLVTADQSGLSVSDDKILERHPLPLPDGLIPANLDWYPDNVHILLSGYNEHTHQMEIWRLSVIGTESRKLLSDATGAVISADGTRMAFIRNSTELWLGDPDGVGAKLLMTVAISDRFTSHPQFSADGRFILVATTGITGVRPGIDAYDIGNAKSTHLYDTHDYILGFILSGNQLLVSEQPDRGIAQSVLKLLDVNLAAGVIKARQAVISTTHRIIQNFSATRDGQRVVCIEGNSQSDVYVAALNASGTVISSNRRLTLNDSLDKPSGWMGNSSDVLFYSNRNYRFELYTQAVGAADAQLLAGGNKSYFRGVVTADQMWMYYFELNTDMLTLKRQPVAGGIAEVIDVKKDPFRQVRCATHANICVVANYSSDEVSLVSLTDQGRAGNELVRFKWEPTYTSEIWDISPDGTRIAYIDTTSELNQIHVVELNSNHQPALILNVADHDTLRTLYWDASGEGFYVSTYDTNGRVLQLLHLSLKGAVHVLRIQASTGEGWAIPSPDGRYLAYQKWTTEGNLWQLEQKH